MNVDPVPKRILVVDDDFLLRRMVAKVLRHDGLAVSEVGSGEDALGRFAADPHDLVLLDLEMRGLGGHAVCARLRGSVAGSYVPILILSGRDDLDSIALARQQGATDFIAKPIDWAGLAQRVRAALRAIDPGMAPAPATLEVRVLLATTLDDEQRLIVAALRQAGLTVTAVGNGEAAVESALQHDYDVVLMGVRMPTMDGCAATRMLRACGYRRPIVALAGSASSQDVAHCREAGSDEVLIRPFELAHFREVVAKQLSANAASRRAPEDRLYVQELAEHAAAFRLALPAQIDSMRKLLRAQQWPALTRLVHALKGTAGSFGFEGLGALAGAIETELRAERTARISSLCEGLFREADRALAATPHG